MKNGKRKKIKIGIKIKMSSLILNTNQMWSTIGKNTCPASVIRFSFTEGAVDKGARGFPKDLYLK